MMQHGLAKPSAHACYMICTGLKTKRLRMTFDAAHEDQEHSACMMEDDDDRAMTFGLEDQARPW